MWGKKYELKFDFDDEPRLLEPRSVSRSSGSAYESHRYIPLKGRTATGTERSLLSVSENDEQIMVTISFRLPDVSTWFRKSRR